MDQAICSDNRMMICAHSYDCSNANGVLSIVCICCTSMKLKKILMENLVGTVLVFVIHNTC